MKNIQLRHIEDSLYFMALEWKGRLKCESWEALFRKIFGNRDLLETIAEKDRIKSVGVTWARDIDARLDRRDAEILKNKEDIMV